MAASLQPVPPPITLEGAPGGAPAAVGLNGTSASVNVTLANSAQLLYNPDLYESPDGWYCLHLWAGSSSSLSCYWLPSEDGSSGGVALIYGSLSALSDDDGEVGQVFTVPSAGVVSATLSARMRYAQAPGLSLVFYVMGVINETGGLVAFTYGPAPSSYTTYTLQVNASQLIPGHRYLAFAGVYAYSLTEGTLAFLVDWIRLDITTRDYTYSNVVLAANNTGAQPYYARLVLAGVEGDASQLSLNLTLRNSGGDESTAIQIVNGSATSTATSYVEAPPSPQGYSSLVIQLSASAASKSNASLHLYLEYCSQPGGAGGCAWYPVTVNLDPAPSNATRGAGAPSVEPPWGPPRSLEEVPIRCAPARRS